MQNHYYDEFIEISNSCTPIGSTFMFPTMFLFEKREILVRKYAWSITSPKLLETISQLENKKIIEIGAGNGYWAYMLSQYGMKVVAFDFTPWEKKGRYLDIHWRVERVYSR